MSQYYSNTKYYQIMSVKIDKTQIIKGENKFFRFLFEYNKQAKFPLMIKTVFLHSSEGKNIFFISLGGQRRNP